MKGNPIENWWVVIFFNISSNDDISLRISDSIESISKFFIGINELFEAFNFFPQNLKEFR